MGSQYAGDPNNYPADFTVPGDFDPPTATAFNVPARALGDRTAFLKARQDGLATFAGQLQSLNVGKEIVPFGITGAPGLLGAFFDTHVGRWLFCGEQKELRGAYNVTAPDTNTRMNAGTTADDLFGGAAKPTDGTILVTVKAKNVVMRSTDAGASWQRTSVGAAETAISETTPRVLWTGSTWLYFAAETFFLRIYTAADGFDWIEAAASNTMHAENYTCVATDGTKIVVASAQPNNGNGVYVGFTTDAGATFTTSNTSIAHSQTVVDQLSLVYVASTAEWILTIGDSTTRTSEVWASSDASTWTKRKTFAHACIMGDVAVYGGTIVGAARTDATSLVLDDIVYSPDAGTTWKTTRQRLTGVTRGAYVGDGCVVFVTGTGYWPALAEGDPAIALT